MLAGTTDLSTVTSVNVARLGEGGKFAAASLAGGLLRFEWEQLTFEELTSAPLEVVRDKLLRSTATDQGEATRDFGRLELFRHSGPDELWVAFVNNEMWWTRLVAGPIEQDDKSALRRTSSWSNRSLSGRPLDFASLSEGARGVNRSSPSSARRVQDEGHRQAILEDIAGTRLPSRGQSVAVVPVVTGQQRDVLRRLWERLRRPVGWVGEVGTAGHGLQVCQGPGKSRWCASMYWSNSKTGNAVSFCIHSGRLILGDWERKEFLQWLAFQRTALNGRDAEIRSAEEQVQDAFRVGFDYENGLEFLRRWAAALDPFAPNPNARWVLPPSGVAASGSEPSSTELPALTDATLASSDALESAGETSAVAEGVDPIAISIQQMVRNAHGAAAESGKVRERVAKAKEVRMSSDELAAHLRELIEEQGRRCKLSNLPLHFGEVSPDGDIDSERLASLDRIDSNGHYERGNLQVVCWFVNRWKSDDTQENFLRLLELLSQRATDGGVTTPKVG